MIEPDTAKAERIPESFSGIDGRFDLPSSLSQVNEICKAGLKGRLAKHIASSNCMRRDGDCADFHPEKLQIFWVRKRLTFQLNQI